MENGGSLPRSQQPATCTLTRQTQKWPIIPFYFFRINLDIIFQPKPWFWNSSVSCWFPYQRGRQTKNHLVTFRWDIRDVLI